MAFVTAYLDDSGTHDGSQFTLIGGGIASAESWVSLESTWKDILTEFGVSEFHSADCRSGRGIFEGHSQSKRDKLPIDLANAASETITFMMGFGVKQSEYLNIATSRNSKKSPYRFCAELCLKQIHFWRKETEGTPL